MTVTNSNIHQGLGTILQGPRRADREFAAQRPYPPIPSAKILTGGYHGLCMVIADDSLSLKDQPSLPASRPSGPVACEHSASVHEREFEMSLFSLPFN